MNRLDKRIREIDQQMQTTTDTNEWLRLAAERVAWMRIAKPNQVPRTRARDRFVGDNA